MSTGKRDLVVTALKNAYGAEGQAETTLSKFHDDLENYPELKSWTARNLDETKQHKARLEQLLESMGESPSSFKETVMKTAASIQGLIHSSAGDEVLKSSFTVYAYKHFEVAMYRSLLAMAEDAGEPTVAAAAREMMSHDEAAAKEMGGLIDSTTKAYMIRESAGIAASA